jgi:hypothetical protein
VCPAAQSPLSATCFLVLWVVPYMSNKLLICRNLLGFIFIACNQNSGQNTGIFLGCWTFTVIYPFSYHEFSRHQNIIIQRKKQRNIWKDKIIFFLIHYLTSIVWW